MTVDGERRTAGRAKTPRGDGPSAVPRAFWLATSYTGADGTLYVQHPRVVSVADVRAFWLTANAIPFRPGEIAQHLRVIESLAPRGPFEKPDPLCLFFGASLFGVPETVDAYVARDAKNWVLRSRPIRPPDDPFTSYKLAAKDPRWRLAGGGQQVQEDFVRNAAFEGLLRLVRTAYRAPGLEPQYMGASNPADFDKYHAAFLSVGGHWDERKQRYARRDGSTLP